METYIIEKVLNSSVVLAQNRNEEVIILGKGIGYGKKRGEIVTEDQVSRVFRSGSATELEKMLADVDPKVVDVSTRIVTLVEARFPDTAQNLLVSLIDHISFALKRLKAGMIFENKLYYDVQTYYPDEFALGSQAVAIINEAFNIELPKMEAASIAFHIADARNAKDTDYDSMKITKMTDEIIRLIVVLTGHEPDITKLSYRRLVTHVKFFAERILTNQQLNGDDRVMYDHVLAQYKDATSLAIKVLEFLDKQYGIKVTSEELMYLIVHINRNMRAD